MRFKYIFLLKIFSFSFSHASLEDAQLSGSVLFKVGLELQEGSRLLSGDPFSGETPIYEYDQSVQKRPVFIVKRKNDQKKLLKIEIDTQDIEFITYPFSSQEERDLLEAVDVIKASCQSLKENFHQLSRDYQAYFDKRETKRKSYLRDQRKMFGGEMTDEEFTAYEKKENFLKETYPGPFVTFETWYTYLENSVGHENFIETGDCFEAVKTRPIFLKKYPFPIPMDTKTPINTSFLENYENWFPRFCPQLTIQLPLENVIHFLFTFFDSHREMQQKFLNYLPDVKEKTNVGDFLGLNSGLLWNEGYYKDKKRGLMFLHAMTLYELVCFSGNLSQEQELRKFMIDFEESSQVDAKSCLSVISRRPFNEMWHDIRKSYAEGYDLISSLNNPFFSQKITRASFSRVNYAREFFENNQRKNLEVFLARMNLSEDIKENARKLLEIGVFPLSLMIELKDSHWRENFWKEYFENACDIGRDCYKRYNINGYSIECSRVSYDALSPPWFLDDTDETGDAMGYFRHDRETSYGPRDPLFGEAIIEVRNINDSSIEDNEGFFDDFKAFLKRKICIMH